VAISTGYGRPLNFNLQILAGPVLRNLVRQASLLNHFFVAQTHAGDVLKFVGAVFAMRNRDFLRRGSKPGKDDVLSIHRYA
jgi:hypothetical protein